ncbi:hypothetical protein RLIN73S_04943 [Rhodanobacter lindaniclasticus]
MLRPPGFRWSRRRCRRSPPPARARRVAAAVAAAAGALAGAPAALRAAASLACNSAISLSFNDSRCSFLALMSVRSFNRAFRSPLCCCRLATLSRVRSNSSRKLAADWSVLPDDCPPAAVPPACGGTRASRSSLPAVPVVGDPEDDARVAASATTAGLPRCAGAPVAVLPAHFGGRRGQGHGLRLGCAGHAQHRAALQGVDVVTIESIGIGLLQGQHHLAHVNASRCHAAGDPRQRLPALHRETTVLAHGGCRRAGDGRRLRCGGRSTRGGTGRGWTGLAGRRGGCWRRRGRSHRVRARRIEQDRVLAHAGPVLAIHFNEEIEVGIVHRHAAGDADHRVRTGGHAETQRNVSAPADDAGPRKLLAGSQFHLEALQFGRIGRVHRNLRQQRLPQRRLDLDLAQFHRQQLTAAQRQRHQHRQLQRTIHA